MKKFFVEIASFAVLVLMIVGVGGLMYHAIGTDGWIAGLLENIMHHSFGSALGILIALGVSIWLGRRWTLRNQSHKLFNDGIMYVFAALGLYFAGHLLLTGSF